ncbi:PDDEXK nuclease domain-containing protein [Arthrobacter sp. 2MCAF15]|uniref:PDDEXK nuclease domain-containing protein n=1 Tax=Arthrobacter sp. 2MCAF15 TaxID=3232984 RepID=UPI003F8DDFAD
MTLRLAQTLAEFGAGFAFVGRQYHLDVDGDDFFVDLLLHHVPSDRYVVVELKTGKFKPEHLGQLNFYVAAVNDMLRLPRQALTVGILMCDGRDPDVLIQERPHCALCPRWFRATPDRRDLHIRGTSGR